MSEKALALLRGINVGGKNILPMKALTELFTRAGSTRVKTYIQSGNVIFHSRDPHQVAETVRHEIASRFGFQTPVILRSPPEMDMVLTANPFLNRDIDLNQLHVMFLADQAGSDLAGALDQARSPADEFARINREIYLLLPNGAARTKLTNAYFDSRLKTISTQRNWRTVLKLAELLKSETALS